MPSEAQPIFKKSLIKKLKLRNYVKRIANEEIK